MTDIKNKLKNLSPEQKAALEKKLRKKALQVVEANRITVRKDLTMLPLSFEQERLWFLNQLNPKSSFYNMPAAIKITGTINLKSLEFALNKIFERHQILNTTIIHEGNEPKQIFSNKKFNFDVEQFNSQKNSDIKIYLNELANKPFELNEGPLYRVKLIKISELENILFLSFHHIIADGWSIGIIINELSAYYKAYNNNPQFDLKALDIQYFDFAEHRKGQLTEQLKKKEITYWKNKLEGMPDILEFPLDFSRPAIQSYNGDKVKITIPYSEYLKLNEIGKNSNATQFVTYLTILQILLFRFTNQNDFGIGTPSNGRLKSELNNLIGFFVNTIVIRSKLSDNISFSDLLREVKTTVLESFDHQNLPFEEIVNGLGIKKSISHTPLFQVMFDYQESPFRNINFSGLELEFIDLDILSAKFDLVFIIEELKEEVNLSIEFNTDIFKKETIVSIAKMFVNLIKEINKNPNKIISLFKLIPITEEEKIIKLWNPETSIYPNNINVSRLFENQVEITPDKVAVKYNNENITYTDLNIRSNQLANYLLKQNIKINDKVAIFMERSSELIAVTLAILKVGATYVPLDIAYPVNRIEYMLNDVEAKIVISQKSLSDISQKFNCRIIEIESIYEQLINENKRNLNIESLPDDVAYIIYTSGSTGKPKGVMVPHKAIVRLVKNANYVNIKESDKIAQLANTSFDAATFEIWGALLNGAESVIIDKETALIPDKFIHELKSNEITIIFITTALFNQTIYENPNAFKTLDSLLFGGEKVDTNAVHKLLQNHPPKNLLHVYGPTENTTFSTWYKIEHVEKNQITIPIGKPISNSTIYVVDKNMQLVPAGVPGELYLGGAGLARGYLNQLEITKSSFVKNPFDKNSNSLLYKTGDLVRYKSDGNVEFIGRVDNQVKIRGFRIELGEIENEIKKVVGIKDAVVTVEGNSSNERKLIAYIILNDDNSNILKELSYSLAKTLPDYMIPKNFVKIDKIPLNPNGKIDKKALTQFNKEEIADTEIVEPRNEFEKYIAEIWKEILNINNVSIHKSFFEYGGNSLQAAVFINRLQKHLNKEIQVQSIFLAPTIAEFSHYAFEYFSEIINEKFGEINSNSNKEFDIEISSKLTEEKISEFKNIVKVNSSSIVNQHPKNPSAIFILSPPRSGSTLLRVMLEGHDKLFSPPELDLLSFDTLEDRKQVLSGNYSLWLEATIRAIMELKNCDSNEAEKIMQFYELEKLSIKEFYMLLQKWAGNKILVDKTPTYALDINILHRAEQYFDNPLYIHLIRHPYASIYSFIEAKLDKNFFRQKNPFTRRELAELIWLVSHDNINTFLDGISDKRKIQIKFEDIVANTELEMKKLASFIGINYDEKLLNPYSGKRMTDAVKENSQMVGDFKFYLRNKVDSTVINRWKNYHKKDFLYNQSVNLAAQFGYDLSIKSRTVNVDDNYKNFTIEKITRTNNLPLSFAQQRIWFLEQLEPGKSIYNIPAVVELKGLLQFDLLEKSINKIIERHESLRTYFTNIDGKANQVILDKLTVQLIKTDLSNLSNDEKIKNTNQIIQRETTKPFDLIKAPLLTTKLLILDKLDYVLILNFHHIISDGWSLEIFVKELSEFYSAFVNNTKPNIREPEFQYVDYAAWQRKWFEGKHFEKQLDYWKNQLSNSPKLLELPTDFTRSPVQQNVGRRIEFIIDSEIVEKINKLVKREDLTHNIIFFSAFAILLNKYSNSEDILIGIPVAGRNRAEIENLIGLFVNTIIIRTDFSKKITVKQLLKNVQNVFIEALNNQEVPFERLIDDLKIKRSLSHTPLFQVMFVYNISPISNLTSKDLIIQPKSIDLKNSKFDINFVVTKRNEKVKCVFEYNVELFKEETILRMIDHYENILSKIVADLNKTIDRLEIISDIEKNKLVNELNSSRKDYPTYNSLHKCFESNLGSFKERTAIKFKNDSITFDELNKRANQIANYLIKKGVKKESIVGVCLERSIESIISIFAIWKAGAVYLPLDPNYPIDRLNYVIKNSKSLLLICEKEIAEKINNIDSIKIILSEEFNLIRNEHNANLKYEVFPENLAYIIYTSGSTGKPKGVMIQHKSALNLANELNEKIYSASRVNKLNISLNAPLPFDASMQEIIMLLFGHTLIIISEEIRLDGNAFISFIQNQKIDLLDCVPAQLKILIELGILSEKYQFPKFILPGGEAIDVFTWEKLKKAEHINVFNMYGPTECTVDSTICKVKNNLSKPTIGKPINNVDHYILDAKMNLVPFGVPGELYISGECLARGYYENPDLTAEKFLPNLFDEDGGKRIYKTGDLVRYQNDGNLEYLGRTDSQVKLRGFRIELGEIESILKSHSEIKDSVVMIIEEINGSKKLVAYYITKNKMQLTDSELKDYLSQKLPEYMIPNYFVQLKHFPMLTNKKINRNAFPKPENKRETINSELNNPTNENEQKLYDIWKSILNLESFGVNDNFFELGGDSILGIQVISKANQAGIKITPKNLFQSPSIKGLANLAGKGKTLTADQQLLIGKVELSPIQMWFFDQSFRNKNHWNQSILLEFAEELDEEILKLSIQKIIEHHDALRIRFERVEETWQQYYMEMFDELPFKVEESLSDDYEKIKEISNKHQTSLDIKKGKVIKFVYIKTKHKYYLLIIAHHLVIDSVSWRIILEDLQNLYSQLQIDKKYKLPLKSTSYRYWTKTLRKYIESPEIHSDISFWKVQKELQSEIKAFNNYQVENLENSAVSISFSLDSKLTDSLINETPKFYNTDITDSLLTVLLRTNSIWKGDRKLSVTLESHGRENINDEIDLSRTVGWFTSIYPIVLDLGTSIRPSDSLKLVKEQLRKIPNNGVSYGLLKYLMNESDLPHLSRVSFNYLGKFNINNEFNSFFKILEENKGIERAEENLRPFELDFVSSIVNGKINFKLIFNKNTYSKKEMNDFRNFYINELKSLIYETTSGSGGYTPSDFKEADLNDQELDSIFTELNEDFEND